MGLVVCCPINCFRGLAAGTSTEYIGTLRLGLCRASIDYFSFLGTLRVRVLSLPALVPCTRYRVQGTRYIRHSQELPRLILSNLLVGTSSVLGRNAFQYLLPVWSVSNQLSPHLYENENE